VEVLSSRLILVVEDLARSRRFYEDVLGLRVYREYGADGVVTGVVYFLGGGFLEVTQGSSQADDGAVLSRRVRLFLQVPDLEAEAARLVDAGVSVRKERGRMPWGLEEMWILDPDGFEVRLVEVPSEHPLRRRVD
jgi:catechol 2,3-dioxygenase-like lactoylglutathione lyase family enzyme